MTRFRRLTAVRRRVVATALLAVLAGVVSTGYVVVTALAAPSHPALVAATRAANPMRAFADNTAPSITLTFPADDGSYGPTTWAAGCAPAGICGRASDRSGVRSVAVAILDPSSGTYWGGSAFLSSDPVFIAAAGTTSWRYRFTPPLDGEYVVFVEATDDLGNTTDPYQLTTARFFYDTAILRAPVITSGPSSPFTQRTVEFTFTDRGSPRDIFFHCRLDSGPVAACTGDTDHDGDGRLSPPGPFGGREAEGEKQYTNLAPGRHCFSVYATDREGTRSPTTTDCWTIPGAARNFRVGGDLTSPLFPGTSERLDLTFTNPNSAPITIASGGVTAANIAITTNKPGCAGSNFAVTHGLTASVTIAAHQTAPISLSALGIPQADWPVITMIETHTNQDACQGAMLTLTYSGIEATG